VHGIQAEARTVDAAFRRPRESTQCLPVGDTSSNSASDTNAEVKAQFAADNVSFGEDTQTRWVRRALSTSRRVSLVAELGIDAVTAFDNPANGLTDAQLAGIAIKNGSLEVSLSGPVSQDEVARVRKLAGNAAAWVPTVAPGCQ
jgi:hypothetical protein